MVGCQGNVKPSSQGVVAEAIVPPVTAPTKPTVTDTKVSEKITVEQKPALTAEEIVTQRLIVQGDIALEEQRLLTPVDDNANLYFQVVLGRDPGNYQAIQGIAAIVDRYTQWAWQAAQNRDYQKAARNVDFARSVNPEDPVITEMTTRIQDLKDRRRAAAAAPRKEPVSQREALMPKIGRFILPKTLFSLPEEEIITEIQPIIDEVAKTQQSLAIYWPNDKEARLIYQIINSRVTEFRVRAMIFHRADYKVDLVSE
ncbi:hypothetical protein J9B83_08540 [Marinomonas sp. A79]|uniref:Lipoprotein n=2 Tax=Marinomonas vulgaris TaxID=2823372 RepID=A0ABS5HBG3_9GAMM|nr:hypothetical protein [Marinomonas vulgaris]